MLWPTLVTHTTCRLEMSVEGLQYTLVGSESVPVLHFWHLPPSLMRPAGHFVHLLRCGLGSVPLSQSSHFVPLLTAISSASPQ